MAKATAKGVAVIGSEKIDGKTLVNNVSAGIEKLDSLEVKLTDFRERFTGLTIVDINDKVGYEKVKDALAEMRKFRTGTKEEKQQIKAPIILIGTTIDQKFNYVIESVNEIEAPLQQRREEIDAEKEKIKIQKKQEQDKALIIRQQELSSMGVLFDPETNNFVLDDIIIEQSLVRESDQDVYMEMIYLPFKEKFDANEKIRLDKEKADQDEKDKLQREKDEFEEKQKEFERQKLEFEAKQKEAQDKIDEENRIKTKQKIDARCKQLSDLGMTFNFQNDCFVFEGGINIDNKTEVCLWSDEEWNAAIERITPIIAQKKQDAIDNAKKEEERTELQRARLEKLLPYNKFGDTVDMATLWNLSETNFNQLFDNKKAAYDKHQEEEKEAQRKAILGETRNSLLKPFNIPIMLDSTLGDLSEEEWNNFYDTEKKKYDDEIKRKDDQRKQEELEKSGDKVQWENFIENLKAITIPSALKSGQYKAAAKTAQEKINEIIALK